MLMGPSPATPLATIHVRSIASLRRRASRCPLLKELLCGQIRLAVRAAFKLVLYTCLSAESSDLERALFPVQIFRDGGQCYRFTTGEEGCVHEVGWADAVWVYRHLGEDTHGAFCEVRLGGP